MRGEATEYVLTLDVTGFGEPDPTVEVLGPEWTIRTLEIAPSEDGGLRRRELLEESSRLPDDANLERVTAHLDPESLVIDVPRKHLERRELPIEGSQFAVNHYAEAV